MTHSNRNQALARGSRAENAEATAAATAETATSIGETGDSQSNKNDNTDKSDKNDNEANEGNTNYDKSEDNNKDLPLLVLWWVELKIIWMTHSWDWKENWVLDFCHLLSHQISIGRHGVWLTHLGTMLHERHRNFHQLADAIIVQAEAENEAQNLGSLSLEEWED